MSRQYMTLEGYINETEEREFLGPGGAYLNDTTEGDSGGSSGSGHDVFDQPIFGDLFSPLMAGV
jgi:hypothetical protein